MLMRRMKRWLGIALVLALAVLPVLHSHALTSDNAGSSCVTCAAGTSDLAVAPALSAPLTHSYALTAAVVMTIGVPVAASCSPRAPPQA